MVSTQIRIIQKYFYMVDQKLEQNHTGNKQVMIIYY